MKYRKLLKRAVEIIAASLSYSETEVTRTGTKDPAWQEMRNVETPKNPTVSTDMVLVTG